MSQYSERLKRESRRFLAMKWTGPYLLVPVLMIACLVMESRLQETGLFAYIPVGMRSGYSIWRVLMLVCVVTTPLTSFFLGHSWKSGGFARYFYSQFFGTFTACLLAAFIVMTSAVFALLPPLTVPVGFVAAHFFPGALVVAFWAVSTAFLCSSITSGPGASALSLGLFSLGLFPGLAGSSMSYWFVGPLGDMVKGSQEAVFAVAGHSVFYLLFSLLILRKTTR